MEQDLFVWLNWKRWFFSLSPNGSGIAEGGGIKPPKLIKSTKDEYRYKSL